MPVKEIFAKAILQKSGIPGADYVINPYTGCTHGCVYCYARFMKRFSGHAEEWGAFLDAKINAPALLRAELSRKRKRPSGQVFLSSVTDPYLPAEEKYLLTRGVLEVLLEFQLPVSILTKSGLVLRDLDLFKQFKECSVGLSLMTADDQLGRRFDQRVTPPSKRIQALRTLKEAGVSTYAFISPFLPRLSEIEPLIEALDGAVDEIGIEALNLYAQSWVGVQEVIIKYYPQVLLGYPGLVKNDVFWGELEQKAARLTAEHGMKFMGLFQH
jgi:DNA repair photolyase